MLVNTENKGLNLYTIPIRERVSVWIEQDILVPDTKPDAIKIINVTVNPYVTDIEVMDNKIKVTGKINYYVIYRTNETIMGTRGLYVSLPYTQVLNVKGIQKNTDVRVRPIVKNVIYSLPNERKIAIKTEVIFRVKGVESIYVNLIQNFSPDYKVETKLNRNEFNNLIRSKYNIIASKEDIMISKDNEDFYEILKVEPSIINTEYKESYNKIMVKGDIVVNVLYLVDNQDTEIKKIILEIPFSGMIEMDNINDKSKFTLDFVINDFNIKPNTEMLTTKTMSVEYQIGVYVNMYEQEEISYVDDFYCEDKELKYEKIVTRAVRDENTIVKNIDIKETLNNILLDNSKLLDYTIDTSYILLKQTANNINIEGNVKIGILVQNLDTLEIENKVVDVLVNEEFIIDEIKPDTNISLNIFADKASIIQNGNDMDIKLKLNLNIKSENIVDLNLADKIEVNDLNVTDLDSMNIYIVKPKDNLWSIAKKYNTTVDKIVQTNDITDQSIINVGQKILIIR
ncbi:MAG: DUF3794 domain-containing protein [Clostridia bacterium]|nr:DUF3794 domain-containing protein [Clostridia bacterium]MDD4386176.1 DUF3794 domain-containing protein [Clostridia bacterium]